MNVKAAHRSIIILIALILAFTTFCISTTEISSAASRPAKVSSLTISSITSSSCKLSWKKVRKAKGYQIYRKKGSGKYKRIKTLTATSYKNTGLSGSSKYSYKVRALKKSGKRTIYGKFSYVETITTKKYIPVSIVFDPDPVGSYFSHYPGSIVLNSIKATCEGEDNDYTLTISGKFTVIEPYYDDYAPVFLYEVLDSRGRCIASGSISCNCPEYEEYMEGTHTFEELIWGLTKGAYYLNITSGEY